MDVAGSVSKIEGPIIKFGVPIAAIIGGALIGDAFGLTGMLTGFVSQINAKVAGIFVAAGLGIAGLYISRAWDGIVGKAVGFFLVGMSLGIVYESLTGKKFAIPGM